MPFPWKKTKGSRISRFADQFNTSKHGGSLVVQTGFPTSIIDLFHKNRDRLKKSAKKKRSSGFDSVSYGNSDSQLGNPERCAINSEVELLNMDVGMVNSDRCLTNRTEDDLVNGKERGGEVVDNRGNIFIVILKVLLMVILALVTRRLVVGVSVSAFSLFLLEYVGNYVYGLSKLCSDYRKMLKVIVAKVLCFVRIKGGAASICHDSVKDINLNVQSVEIEADLGDVIEPVVSLDSDKGLEFERMELKIIDIMKEDEPKQEGSRKARLKTKMRKLVRKKLCKSRRKGSGLESVVPGFGSEVPESMEEDTCIGKDGSNELREIEGQGELNEDEVNISQISLDPCDLILSKDSFVEESGRETLWISKYWVFCLIILSGLVGGRIFAIVFTLAWCLILKPLGNKGDAQPSLRSSGKNCA
ncbi:hypothetical protein DCAR_0104076 [Daucus carota subsp. sativus]|uniref:Uncharacterized protein n=1 Tax=Daucus carota subsp. sativus TaxID=79200 RepID=A0A166IJ04_DAUCS|nr:PREDICTED: uncharacterized protein LOC108205491 [Daucus carota subsp. sativus]WOG84891.1 hypothetical protein DCAR_0104076 [Daucus carota subsp. sativus]